MSTVAQVDNNLLRAFAPIVVVVDDCFTKLDFSRIDGTDSARFERTVTEAQIEALRAEIPQLDSVEDFLVDELLLEDAWKLWKAKPLEYRFLNALFQGFDAQAGAPSAPVEELVTFLRDTVGFDVKTHPSVEEAEDDIKASRLLFLDFNLKGQVPELEAGQTYAGAIIESYEQWGALLSEGARIDGASLERYVILMSSNLPDVPDLERFRQTTKIRSAFFQAVDKARITAEWTAKQLREKCNGDLTARGLSNMLNSFKQAVEHAARGLMEDIERLELHDLAFLQASRLNTEEQHIGNYLSWLFSEALAARTRGRPELSTAGAAIPDANQLYFSGRLRPGSLLFQLYSEVAFSYPWNVRPGRLRFGDVLREKHILDQLDFPLSMLEDLEQDCRHWLDFAARQEVSESRMLNTGDKLLLVMSPACDLLRCSEDFEVLVVRGTVVQTVPDIVSAFGMPHPVSDGYMMRRSSDPDDGVALIKWKTKAIKTVRWRTLANPRLFERCGRLNDTFSNDIKQKLMSDLSRVGVPIDPSFARPMTGCLWIKGTVQGAQPILVKFPTEFVSMVQIGGRKGTASESGVVVLSEELVGWLSEELPKKFPAGNAGAAALPGPVTNFVAELLEQPGYRFNIEKSVARFSRVSGKISFEDEFVEGNLAVKEAVHIQCYPYVTGVKPADALEQGLNGAP
ncbi:hypothetical protein [Paraburkholderia xenovorans]|uniref:hypothetical protein n=1 Tax=Paraburkholderia xenovorans TaxID=36873 RepID=UPI0015C5310A|nr:hypothetical protein [Paraburkholderia xenovorans]NPT32898.1 hypothetical protein [Paraburkholderia xenovorans]